MCVCVCVCVSVCVCVCLCVCVSVCLSVKSHLTSGASVCPENPVTYSAGNGGQKICGVFSDTARLQRSSIPLFKAIQCTYSRLFSCRKCTCVFNHAYAVSGLLRFVNCHWLALQARSVQWHELIAWRVLHFSAFIFI